MNCFDWLTMVILRVTDYEQSLFFLVRLAKRARHANDLAPSFLASPLTRACTPLTKSEEKERLLAVLE